jgi:uncharacterized protein YndB with AHSA1/START domain
VNDRVELQAEVDATRDLVFPLFATADGLRRWVDSATLDARVGGEMRIQMRDAQAVGKVLALDPPQHISFQWDWLGQPLGAASVVAFDAIDHGVRTWVTIRHVGLPDAAQVQLHEEMWRYWMQRFIAAVRGLPRPATYSPSE